MLMVVTPNSHLWYLVQDSLLGPLDPDVDSTVLPPDDRVQDWQRRRLLADWAQETT